MERRALEEAVDERGTAPPSARPAQRTRQARRGRPPGRELVRITLRHVSLALAVISLAVLFGAGLALAAGWLLGY